MNYQNSPSARERALDFFAKLRKEKLIAFLLLFAVGHVEVVSLYG
jgi:hypothetical protein